MRKEQIKIAYEEEALQDGSMDVRKLAPALLSFGALCERVNEEGWLCQSCADEHECGEDMLLPVVNSPRTGVCGYAG